MSVLLSLISGTVVFAEGVDGFGLGMPMAKVRQLAIEKGYTFSNPTGSSVGGRWISYVLFGNGSTGPSMSFCDTTLSSMSLQRPSSLHEIMLVTIQTYLRCVASQREGSMRKFAIGLFTLAMYAASLPIIAMIAPAKAATSSSGNIQKHKKYWRPRVGEPWYVGQAQAFVPPYSQAGPICPGNARGIDCRVFPPPIQDDPDRKRAGGGG